MQIINSSHSRFFQLCLLHHMLSNVEAELLHLVSRAFYKENFCSSNICTGQFQLIILPATKITYGQLQAAGIILFDLLRSIQRNVEQKEILQINGRGWLKCEHKTCRINYQETLPVISILLLEEKYHLNTFLLIQHCSLQMIKLYNHQHTEYLWQSPGERNLANLLDVIFVLPSLKIIPLIFIAKYCVNHNKVKHSYKP